MVKHLLPNEVFEISNSKFEIVVKSKVYSSMVFTKNDIFISFMIKDKSQKSEFSFEGEKDSL